MKSVRGGLGVKGIQGIIIFGNCSAPSLSLPLRPTQRLRFADRKADMADKKQISSSSSKDKDKAVVEGEKKMREEEKEEEEESPPEKPLPGDCCGSGCVRCVWDMYYEELEDYNNRQEQKKKKG